MKLCFNIGLLSDNPRHKTYEIIAENANPRLTTPIGGTRSPARSGHPRPEEARRQERRQLTKKGRSSESARFGKKQKKPSRRAATDARERIPTALKTGVFASVFSGKIEQGAFSDSKRLKTPF
jgi:hypothetical protein